MEPYFNNFMVWTSNPNVDNVSMKLCELLDIFKMHYYAFDMLKHEICLSFYKLLFISNNFVLTLTTQTKCPIEPLSSNTPVQCPTIFASLN